MRSWRTHGTAVLATLLGLLAPAASRVAAADTADAAGDTALSYATIQPSHIRLGESAVIRVTSLYGYLESVPLPSVPGLTFQLLGRTQGFEFGNGQSIPATYILIRVTPQSPGVFSIPALMPGWKPLGLDVLGRKAPDPYVYRPQSSPPPLPVRPAPIPKGVRLAAGGAAFVQLIIPKRALYVGESVPVDIDLGLRPGIVTSVNGPPTLSSGDFTLNNLSRNPIRRDQTIQGSPFLVMTWHTVLAAVKPGDFSVSVTTPLSVRQAPSATDRTDASMLGWPFAQIILNGVAPKDLTISSPASRLTVLPLPTAGQPKDFSGAVGDFQVSSDLSPATAAAGEPQTLRLHVTGAGNFDRVSSTMLDHLDHWKTYPVKSSFTPKNAVGYSGEKVFEQPLIAEGPGPQVIPALELSYFNPRTGQYERARTQPIEVTIAAAPGAAGALTGEQRGQLARGLRPDHPRPGHPVSDLRPLYFRGSFLAVPATLVLILAGLWLAGRRDPGRARSERAERALAQLSAVARSGDPAPFFELARQVLLQAFGERWRMPPGEITAARLRGRLGPAGEDIERLLALADEAKYSDHKPAAADLQRWLRLIRSQLTGRSD